MVGQWDCVDITGEVVVPFHAGRGVPCTGMEHLMLDMRVFVLVIVRCPFLLEVVVAVFKVGFVEPGCWGLLTCQVSLPNSARRALAVPSGAWCCACARAHHTANVFPQNAAFAAGRLVGCCVSIVAIVAESGLLRLKGDPLR